MAIGLKAIKVVVQTVLKAMKLDIPKENARTTSEGYMRITSNNRIRTVE